MYIIFSLASLLYIINYAKEPIHNDVIDRPWMLIILSKLLKERRENDFINNLIVSFELSYLTFLDQFILISYLFAGIPTIQTVFSRRLFDINENRAIRFDVYSRIIFPISYFFLIFILVTYSF